MAADTNKAWLGLDPDADDAQVARTRERLERYLDEAPPELQGWAEAQRRGVRPPALAARPAGSGRASTSARKPRRSPLIALVGIGAAVAIGIGVYNIPEDGASANPTAAGTPGPASPGATAPADAMHAGISGQETPPPLDQGKVDELTKKIAASPKDTTLLKQLANEYSKAAHFEKATQTQARIVEIEPKNTDARLALGVAKFNTGDAVGAEKEWRTVLQQNPRSAEAWYDLGFLCFTSDPPRMDEAEAAWEQVVAIDPNSDLAKTVSSHLDSFKQAVGTSAPTARPTGR